MDSSRSLTSRSVCCPSNELCSCDVRKRTRLFVEFHFDAKKEAGFLGEVQVETYLSDAVAFGFVADFEAQRMIDLAIDVESACQDEVAERRDLISLLVKCLFGTKHVQLHYLEQQVNVAVHEEGPARRTHILDDLAEEVASEVVLRVGLYLGQLLMFKHQEVAVNVG